MKFQITLLPSALRDIDGILAWLGQRSPQGATTWSRRWEEVLDRLGLSADGCVLAPENQDHSVEIRQIVFKTRRGRPYRALFTIRDAHVYVILVRGPGQDLATPEELELPE